MPEECRVGKYDYDPAIPNIPATSFEVQQSGVSDKAGRGVFTKVDIPAGAYLSAETNVAAVDFEPSTVSLIFDITTLEEGADAEILLTYMDGYGFYSRSLVSSFCERVIQSSNAPYRAIAQFPSVSFDREKIQRIAWIQGF